MDKDSLAIVVSLLAAVAVFYYLTDTFIKLPGSPRAKMVVGALLSVVLAWAWIRSGRWRRGCVADTTPRQLQKAGRAMLPAI